MALTNKLEAIGNAIREKTGSTDKMTLEQMATAITGIETGGGGVELPDEVFVFSGDLRYRFTFNGWNWFMENYGDKFITSDVNNVMYLFYNSTELKNIPFAINVANNITKISMAYMFQYCKKLETLPKLNNFKPEELGYIFHDCYSLKEIPEDIDENWDWSYMESQTSNYSCNRQNQFYDCYSLRSIPMSFLSHVCKNSGNSYSYYYNGFFSCYVLDELVGLPLPYTATWTSNAFSNAFNNCFRLKNVTFELNEDGTPKKMNWKSQTIALNEVGVIVTGNFDNARQYHGIPKTKCVSDDASYASLKDDPDWFANNYNYSRYNRLSAIATINSLPDTSEYLAANGGTNTIKFRSIAGTKTDGGAIGDLTEEQIAVATAKGWTVTLT